MASAGSTARIGPFDPGTTTVRRRDRPARLVVAARRGDEHPSVRRTYGHHVLTLVAVASGLVMVGLDSTIVSVAGPAISRHFHPSLSGLRWVTNAYLLALAAGLIAGGKLGNLFGRKRLFVIGAAGFALTSLACGLSGSLGALIGFRAAQGLFGAIMLPQALAILRAAFPPHRLLAAVGIWSIGSSIAIAAGPIAGGLLVDHIGWRAMFFVNLPVGALSLLAGGGVIRESRDRSEGRRLDWPGIALISGTLLSIAGGVIDAEKHGWSHFRPVAWLLTAAVVLTAVIAWELRAERRHGPHIPLGVFRSRELSAGVGMVVTAFFVLFAVLFYVTIYLEWVHGYSAAQTGVRLLPVAAGLAVGAVAAGALVGRVGPRGPLLAGGLLSAAGLIGLAQLESHSSYGAIWPFLALAGLGLGAAQAGAAQAIVAGAARDQAGIAGGLQATAVPVGGLVGLSVIGSLITSRVSDVLAPKLITAGVPAHLAAQLTGTARAVARGVVPIPRGVPAATAHAVTAGAKSAFTSGLDTAMVVAAGIALAAGIGALLAARPVGDTGGAASGPSEPATVTATPTASAPAGRAA